MVRRFGLSYAVAWITAGLAAGSLVFSAPARATEPQNAAHSLAQRFAEETAKKAVPAPPTPTEQTAAKPPPVVAPATKPQSGASSAAPPARPPLDYEMDMLRRARAERAELQKSAATPSSAKAAAPIAATHPGGVKPPATSVATPAATPLVAPVPAPPKRAEATQANEPNSEAAKSDAAKSDVPKSDALKAGVQAKADAPSAATPAVKPVTPSVSPAQPVTLLLTIDGHSSESVGQSHDPVICFAETCFISAGLSAAAIKMNKSDVLKLKETTSNSPDSCKGKMACVYRNVSLEKGALLQLIELGSASGDPSRTYLTEPDASCRSDNGLLTCDNPIATPDFRVWIVPEATAKLAGTVALEEAIAEGLPRENVAHSTDSSDK